MKVIYELRINEKYARRLFKKHEGKTVGEGMVRVIYLPREDQRFQRIGELNKEVSKNEDPGFCYSSEAIYKYTKEEIEKARLFAFKAKNRFEPTGDECGTTYLEETACPICGANEKRKGKLILKASSIPNKDITATIAGEYVFSEKLVDACKKHKIKGISFVPVDLNGKGSRKFFEMQYQKRLHLSEKTVAGVNPWDFSEYEEYEGGFIKGANYYDPPSTEIYNCPMGHLIGLNLLGEPYIRKARNIGNWDLFETYEKFGVKRGLLRPEPLFICSPKFKKMVEEEKLTGFKFNIAQID
jgi:hypothetical protein